MNKKIIFIIILAIALIGSGFGVYYYLSSEDKNTSLTKIEKEWIENNKQNLIDLGVSNDIPVLNYVGEGLVFDYFTDLEKNTGLVVIDYLQLIQGSNRRNGSREQEIAEISRSLKILAKELNVPVIALSQLSRAVEQRPDHKPMMSDLRESGSIEQDADIVMFLYREDYYNPDTERKNIAEVIIGKNRSGSTGSVDLGWLGSYTKFVNLEKRFDD